MNALNFRKYWIWWRRKFSYGSYIGVDGVEWILLVNFRYEFISFHLFYFIILVSLEIHINYHFINKLDVGLYTMLPSWRFSAIITSNTTSDRTKENPAKWFILCWILSYTLITITIFPELVDECLIKPHEFQSSVSKFCLSYLVNDQNQIIRRKLTRITMRILIMIIKIN